jgi:hypothetical protein
MGTRATGTFEITAWEQAAYAERAEGPTLARASVRKTFRGELAGESTAEVLLCGDDGGGIAYTALERVVGRVGDRAGSFILQHGAMRGGDMTQAAGRVVPDSGTGELRGLRGEVTIRHDEQGATFTLDYDFA